MIDVLKLHDVLRFSGLAPDVPFHSVGCSHELKLRKVLDELELPDPGEFEDLKARVQELERELDAEVETAEEAERELREARRELARLADAKAVMA
jgi:hypothetical protein